MHRVSATLILLAAHASVSLSTAAPTCQTSQCGNVKTPCMDDVNGQCYPRTDPSYNVTSGQCRAGTTDCCCTSGCCCPPTLPCQHQNDFKCMPPINTTGQYCQYDKKTGSYPAACVCAAGTMTCNEDPRKCTTPPKPPACKQPLDLLFLVDASKSINHKDPNNFKEMDRGMATIVSELKIGANSVNVAAWTFSMAPKHSGFGFKRYLNNSELEHAISNLPYNNLGRTQTGNALTWALDTQWPTARKNVKHACIVITDGKPTDKIVVPSEKTRAAGIKVFAIGVGGTYNKKSLEVMASQPYSDYVYGLTDFDLTKISKELIKIACNNNTSTDTDNEPRPVFDEADDERTAINVN